MIYKSLRETGCSITQLDLLREIGSGLFDPWCYTREAGVSRGALTVYLCLLRRKGLIQGYRNRGPIPLQLTDAGQEIMRSMAELWKGKGFDHGT